MKKIIFIFALISLFTGSVFAGDIPSFPFLLVKADAEVKVPPDTAKISFTITEFNIDPKEATNSVLQRGQGVLTLAKKLGIESDQVTSTAYAKNARRKKDDSYQDLDILGYEVTQHFTVKMNDISQYSSFVDQLLISLNIENIQSEFDVSAREKIESDLLRQAAKNARKKADDLAAGMGVKVGSVYALTQDDNFASFEAIFGAPSYSTSKSHAQANFVPPPSFDFVPDASGSNMFIPKTISIFKSVSAVYKIK